MPALVFGVHQGHELVRETCTTGSARNALSSHRSCLFQIVKSTLMFRSSARVSAGHVLGSPMHVHVARIPAAVAHANPGMKLDRYRGGLRGGDSHRLLDALVFETMFGGRRSRPGGTSQVAPPRATKLPV